jgi:predicted ArsR family transcriptional regulator
VSIDLVQLYHGGHSARAIAKQVGVSESTVRRRLRQAGVELRRPAGGAAQIRDNACAICGRPMKGHPRCPVCGLLVGSGHEYAEICYDCRRWATVVGRQRLAVIAQRRASQVVVA